METNEQYPAYREASARSDRPDHRLTPYDVLKTFREYEKYRRTAPASDYLMRAHEDGSVYFHNTEDSNFSELFSFDEIRDRTSFAEYDLRRPLWRRILSIWR